VGFSSELMVWSSSGAEWVGVCSSDLAQVYVDEMIAIALLRRHRLSDPLRDLAESDLSLRDILFPDRRVGLRCVGTRDVVFSPYKVIV
jgi:hypothetical protein